MVAALAAASLHLKIRVSIPSVPHQCNRKVPVLLLLLLLRGVCVCVYYPLSATQAVESDK